VEILLPLSNLVILTFDINMAPMAWQIRIQIGKKDAKENGEKEEHNIQNILYKYFPFSLHSVQQPAY